MTASSRPRIWSRGGQHRLQPALQLRQQLVQLQLRKELRAAPGVRLHPWLPLKAICEKA